MGSTVGATSPAQAMSGLDLCAGTQPLRLELASSGAAHTLRFEAEPGLYQLSVVLDARAFDWEALYVDLHKYHNHGQRTGPWDFELGTSRPLVPAYRVVLNGRSIGLWFFQRVSLEDLVHRRFRGRMALHVAEAGEQTLTLEPYRRLDVQWVTARLEADPEDALTPVPEYLREAPGHVPVAAWTDEAFWQRQRERLRGSHRDYQPALERAFAWALQREEANDPRALRTLDIPLLVAAPHLGNTGDTLPRVLECIDEAVARPHWGNPNPDGYSHDGDMGAALLLRALAWAVHMLPDEQFGTERRTRLLEKLRVQGGRFFELALLNRDYWGGSLLQDHGWRSMWTFGTAALHLYGILPEAETWLRYVLPRLRRGVAAMPRDGVIPNTSYRSPHLYLDEAAAFNETFMALGGADWFQAEPWNGITRYLTTVLHAPSDRLLTEQSAALVGGNAFFAHQARCRGDADAAWLERHMVHQATQPRRPGQVTGLHHGILWGFLAAAPRDGGSAAISDDRPCTLHHFEDSALVHYRDQAHDVVVSLQCGPPVSYHADRAARGPCDRLGGAPRAGHFTLFLGGEPMLATPVAGYRLHTFLGSCMLVDGQGQIGDIGYPMSIPSWVHPGHHIRAVRWDEDAQRGIVQLDLAPAYPDELGVAFYVRELVFTGERRIVCRDHVAFDDPRTPAWLFQARSAVGASVVDGTAAMIGESPSLRIDPEPMGLDLAARVERTDVVHNYSSAFENFEHVRYEPTAPARAACVAFVITW